MTKLVTQQMKTHIAKQFIESLDESANTIYYTFTARSHGFEDDDNPPDPGTSLTNTFYDIYDEILFGKRIQPSDARHMIVNNMWESGTVYDIYDDQDQTLSEKSFFVVASEGVNYYVFKCLSNNGGVESTYKPLYSQTDPTDEVYITNDGYHWKYMYTITAAEYSKFATENYVPLLPDISVTNAAIPGSINELKITNPGVGYNAYANGTILESAVNGNTLTYHLTSETSTLSANAEFYLGSTFYIRQGTGEGQAVRIARYLVSQGTRTVLLDEPLNPLPDTNSVWEIAPRVSITGDGTGFKAITTVDPTSNSISTVEIVDSGVNYTYADLTISGNTGYLDAEDNPILNASAELRPIISPPGGHGSDIINELYANKIGISTSFAGTENDTIPISNDYRKIGIIKDPLFANTEITIDTQATNFIDGETIIHYEPQEENLLLQRYTYTVGNYKTLTVASSSGFTAGINLCAPALTAAGFKAAYVRSVSSPNILVNSTDEFATNDVIFASDYARMISGITQASPAVVTTATAHNLSDGDSIRFYSITASNGITDNLSVSYYIKKIDATSFRLYTDSSLLTPKSTSAVATDGYITTATSATTVSSVAATFSGTVNLTGKDDARHTLALGAASAEWQTIRGYYNGVEVDSGDYTQSTTTFKLDNESLSDGDVVVVEMYTSQMTVLEVDYINATTAEVSNRSGKVLRVRNIHGEFSTGSLIKGLTSGTTATIMSLDRAYSTFNQLTQLSVFISDSGIISGNQGGIANTGFSYDQEVYQVVLDPIRNATGYIHSVKNSITRKITNITSDSPALVTTSAAHSFTNGDKITFDKLNGSLLNDGEFSSTYYAKYVTDTTFEVYTNSALTVEFDNTLGGDEATSGYVTAVKAFVGEDKTIFLSGVRGHIQDSDPATNTINTIRTEQGAVAEVNGIIEPDLVDGSGEIIYIENMSPITRANDQTETVKLVFEF